MRSSRVLRKLRSGGIATSFKLNLADARAAEIAAMSGFDCIWTCMEHTPNDWAVIEKQILAGKAYDVDTVVRVSRGGYSDYIRPLEADAAGIMVPHIMSIKQAEEVVRMTRFHPIGRRPLDGGNADGDYCLMPLVDYCEKANRERFVILQIEDPEPMEELEAIASLDGYDMLFFGPADFSQGLGALGEWNHPAISDARKRIAEACVSAGKYAGTVGNPANVQELVDMGYRFINIGADVLGLSQYCKDMLASVADIQI